MKKVKKLRLFGIAVLILIVVIISGYFISDALYYSGLYKNVHVELGDKLPQATAFLKEQGDIEYITDMSTIDVAVEGKHEVLVLFNGKEKKVYIDISDTIAPEVTVKDVDISVYDELLAKDLLVEVIDQSKVKVEYKKKPEFGKAGSYEAVILVEDESGNKTEVISRVNVCRVMPYVEYRYGEEYPTVEDFIFDDRDIGELVSDISKTVGKPGTYYVTIAIDGKNYKSKLIVIDERAPVVVGRDAEISSDEIASGKTLLPSDFVASFYDEDEVTIYFVDKPDYSKEGPVPVCIAVSDTSGNTTTINRQMYIVEHTGFDVAIGSGEVSNTILSTNLDCREATLVSGTVNTNKIGRYPIVVNVDGEEKNICINVVDTDVPTADAVAVTLDKKQDITASMFVSNIKDSTNVEIEFAKEPDKVNRGIQNVTIMLTDEGGNIAYVDSTLNIQYDAVLPAIFGVSDLSTYIRQTPDYMLGVSAIDDVDGEISVTVDDSKVDYEKTGNYEVTYKATDKSGNVVTQKVTVTVKAIDRDLVASMADEILAEITDDSMTTTEKLWAAYVYVQDNVRYINQADQSSVEKAAYDSFTLGTGDCYSYGALMEIFVERLGGETIFVSRYDSKYNHYWRLCNLGTGWYHLDATPRNSSFKCFMKTDAEILSESETYWKYDKSLYPAVETKSYGD